jgi:hypothetical protein
MTIYKALAILISVLVFLLILTVAVYLLPYVLIAILIFWIWRKWRKLFYPWLKDNFQRRRGAHGTRELSKKTQKRIIDI